MLPSPTARLQLQERLTCQYPNSYSVAADGQRFMMLKPVDEDDLFDAIERALAQDARIKEGGDPA